MKQLEMLYEGKAKQVFRTDDPDKIIIHYKDAATAYINIKIATIENKGALNNAISTLIFKELHKAGVKTHYIETINDRDQGCRRVTIIPLEVIVRNVIAGSMAQRLGIEEGTQPGNVIYDICYKKDELGDPLINDHHAVAQGAGLTGHTAALDGGDDIDLTEGLGRGEGLTDDHLEGLETEILVDVAAVDGDGAGAVGEQVHTGHGGLTTAGAVQIGILGLIHVSFPPYLTSSGF